MRSAGRRKRRSEAFWTYITIGVFLLGIIFAATQRTASVYAPSVTAQRPVDCPAAFALAEYEPMLNATDTWSLDLPTVSYLGEYYVTGYNAWDAKQCGKSADDPLLGVGAAGVRIVPGKHVAMAGLPFGTRVYISGLGVYEVQDRGVGPGCVDVACETLAECYAITGRYATYIVED